MPYQMSNEVHRTESSDGQCEVCQAVLSRLENYTFLTLSIEAWETNIFAGSKWRILTGFSNARTIMFQIPTVAFIIQRSKKLDNSKITKSKKYQKMKSVL